MLESNNETINIGGGDRPKRKRLAIKKNKTGDLLKGTEEPLVDNVYININFDEESMDKEKVILFHMNKDELTSANSFIHHIFHKEDAPLSYNRVFSIAIDSSIILIDSSNSISPAVLESEEQDLKYGFPIPLGQENEIYFKGETTAADFTPLNTTEQTWTVNNNLSDDFSITSLKFIHNEITSLISNTIAKGEYGTYNPELYLAITKDNESNISEGFTPVDDLAYEELTNPDVLQKVFYPLDLSNIQKGHTIDLDVKKDNGKYIFE